jgi:tRNA modification GTPase
MFKSSTIVALSSGGLPSGVAVVRLSGPDAKSSLLRLSGSVPKPRRMVLQSVCAADGEIIDRCLVVFFPGPHSFTGEDCVEIHAHGSRAVVSKLLDEITSVENVVLAEAGDFTRRAFEAGKLDLTAVAGLGDLIEAETEGQRRLALARAGGALSEAVGAWRNQLILLRVEVEAQLDFSDEGDVPSELPTEFLSKLSVLVEELRHTLETVQQGRIVREGFRVVLSGAPNVGKSALLNALTRSDVAIVSAEAGTTRDVREVQLNVGGQLILLYDVAGLRLSESVAETEGVRRAHEAMSSADLILWLKAPDVEIVEQDFSMGPPVMVLGTKSDIGAVEGVDLSVSSRDDIGVQLLIDTIASSANRAASGALLVSHKRDMLALVGALEQLVPIGSGDFELELIAERLRAASGALGRLTGEIDSEAVLDQLFAGFCIGK